MKNLFEKVDVFYSLAIAGNRTSFFNKIGTETVTAEIADSAHEIAEKLVSPEASNDLKSISSHLKNVNVGDDLGILKENVQVVLAETVDSNGSIYIDAGTLLTKINRVISVNRSSKGK